MKRTHSHRSLRAAGTLLLIACTATGCVYSNRKRDIDRTPVVNTGMGATILYPGQTPAMPGTHPGMPGAHPGTPGAQPAPAPATPGGAPSPDQQGRQSGSVTPGTGSVTFIGGAQTDEKRTTEIREEPLYYKYLLAPFAIVAAPFVALADKLGGDDEPGPAVPQRAHQKPGPAPAPAPVDYDTRALEAMERELDQRRAGSGAPPRRVAAAPSGASAAPLSIEEELAALQRAPAPSTPARRPAPAPEASPQATPPPPPAPPRASRADAPDAVADGIVDRDGDGRVDQWIYRENGDIVRNVYDDDGDGRPDRVLHYDPQTHRIAEVHEDTNHDGAFDSWTEYRAGQIVRRRADADQDGQVDSWSYFRNDEIARHESDTTGDGFRDRVRFYRAGVLSREEQDNDGDGHAEVTVFFDEKERVARRAEDRDGDGEVDVISHYEKGRLKRRELIDPSAGAPGAL